MGKRKIITIDGEKCTGCGLCIPNCPEGALRIIDGKARLVGDLFCDGLGACLGYCPEGAITVLEREAEPYDERKVMENIVPQGPNVIAAHLEHLASHGETALHTQALSYLREKGLQAPRAQGEAACCGGQAGKAVSTPEHPETRSGGCPGSRSEAWEADRIAGSKTAAAPNAPGAAPNAPGAAPNAPGAAPNAPGASALRQWPIQLHLISPMAAHFQDKDLLLAADCTAYALGGFHGEWLEGKALAIACPKLDDGRDVYREKITALIDHAQVRSITVLMMEVPCCRGLLQLVRDAQAQAKRKVPVRTAIVAIKDGAVRQETAM